jgi:hypothetical protein
MALSFSTLELPIKPQQTPKDLCRKTFRPQEPTLGARQLRGVDGNAALRGFSSPEPDF